MVRYAKRQIISSLIIFASANIKVVYNIAPTVIPCEKILDVFWHTHDPTTLNRQDNDVGRQYRSAIFYHDQKQRSVGSQKEILKKHVFTKNLL